VFCDAILLVKEASAVSGAQAETIVVQVWAGGICLSHGEVEDFEHESKFVLDRGIATKSITAPWGSVRGVAAE
jgi:hypothetical protein